MPISKPESASESTERERDYESEQERAERERAGHGGAFGYGYGDGREPDAALEGAEAEPQQTTTGAVNRDMHARDAEREGWDEPEAGEGEESRATTLSTAEPAARMGYGAGEPDEVEHSDIERGDIEGGDIERSDMESRPVGQNPAMGPDEGLSEDSMSGDAVQTQPHSTPMQPAMVPDAVLASAPATSSNATPTAQSPLATDPGPVLAPETSLDFRERWHGIQAEFIDDPRRAVEDADRLVADVARAFTAGVEERRRGLTSGWENDGHGETEELRLAMRQYRALVDHILQD